MWAIHVGYRRTAQLALEDFVTEGLVIPQATFDDYAKVQNASTATCNFLFIVI
jgi:hypothetical protein